MQKMENVTCKSTIIASTWNLQSKRIDATMQTDLLQTKEQSTSSMENMGVSCQTDDDACFLDKSPISPDDIKINKNVVQTLISFLQETDALRYIFVQFSKLKQPQKFQLDSQKTIGRLETTSVDLFPFALYCGRSGKVAILFGEEAHESWCSHSAKVDIYHKGKPHSIDLSCCPSSFLFFEECAIIGNMVGEVVVVFEEAVVATIKAHDQAISCLITLDRNKFLSASVDGSMFVWQVRGVTLKKVAEQQATISDLPRELRTLTDKENKRHTSIVSVRRHRDDIIIGGETGALWISNISDLSLLPFMVIKEGIDDMRVIKDLLIILTSFGDVLKIDINLKSIQKLRINEVESMCVSDNVIFFRKQKSVCAIDFTSNEELLNEDKSFIIMDVDYNGNLICLDHNSLLNLYVMKE